MNRVAFALFAAAMTVAAGPASALVAFESGDLSEFQLNGAHASNLSITAGAGVGGGSGLTSTATSYTADSAIYSSGASFTEGGTYRTSIFYKAASQASGPDVRLGFIVEQAGTFDGSAPAHKWFEIFGGSSKSAAFNGTSGGSPTEAVTMTIGTWHRMDLELVSLGGDSFRMDATVDDYGSDGLGFSSNVFAGSHTFTDAGLAAATSIHGGFYAHGETTAFDNYDFMAEPASASVPLPAAGALAFLPLGLLLSAAWRRRRA